MFQYRIFTPADKKNYPELINPIYKLWKETWQPTYKMLDNSQLKLDEFLVNENIHTIYFNKIPVCCFMTTPINGKAHYELDRYYLSKYPQGLLAQLMQSKNTCKILLYNNLAVHKDFRGKNSGLPCSLKEIQFSLAVKYFQKSNCDLLIAYCRNEKKLNQIGYNHGAELLLRTQMHNHESDFICIEKKSIKFDTSFEVKRAANAIEKTLEWQPSLSAA